MRRGRRDLLKALFLVALAVVVQTTVFARFRPFGIAPDFLLVTVVLVARYLSPDPAVLLGFTGGLMLDLLGSGPLGLRALVLTVVVAAGSHLRTWTEIAPLYAAVSVGLLSLLGVVLLAVVGTLFGQTTIADADTIQLVVFRPFYDFVFGLMFLPVVWRVLAAKEVWAGIG